MKAIILIGGQGTRLRPFTVDLPKPLLPVVHRPLIEYQLDQLRRHGIREVVLCTAYRAELFRKLFKDSRGGMKFQFVHEDSPLGTGGAVRNAEKYITDTTLILNGDLLNGLDITAFVREHRKHKADISISLTRVKDPTQFGLVETDDNGRIKRFLEKPSWDEITSNTINAGAYLFEPAVLQYIPPGVPYSLERGLFPHLLENKYDLRGFVTKGYWIDIGTVDKYLQVHLDILGKRTPFHPQGMTRKQGFLAGPGTSIGKDVSHDGQGMVALGKGTKVGPFVRFYGSVSLGEGCTVGQGAVLENCVVLGGTKVGEGVRLDRCVIGHDCRLGANSTFGPGRALGDGSVIQRFSQL